MRGRVSYDRVVRDYDLSESSRSTVQRSVTFHRNDAVCNCEVDWHGGTGVENVLLNALPVENILRPSITCARHYAEHVFHAEGDAGPMMYLNFRHGDNEIRLKDRIGSSHRLEIVH